MAERLPELEKERGTGKEMSATRSSPDLLSRFLAAQTAHPDFMTDARVQTMAVTMAVAGSDTTAISLATVFYHLLRNPRCLARLVAEIDGAARARATSPTAMSASSPGTRASSCRTWMRASRRPSGCTRPWACCWNASSRPGGAEIAGHFVPAGTVVGCNAWVVHRDRGVFGEDVEAFRPERWLCADEGRKGTAEEEQRLSLMNSTMLHFGMGSRTCVGKNISLLEVYKLVPSVLRRFTIHLDDAAQEWEIVNAWFVKQHNFKVRFERRDIIQPDVGETAG